MGIVAEPAGRVDGDAVRAAAFLDGARFRDELDLAEDFAQRDDLIGEFALVSIHGDVGEKYAVVVEDSSLFACCFEAAHGDGRAGVGEDVAYHYVEACRTQGGKDGEGIALADGDARRWGKVYPFANEVDQFRVEFDDGVSRGGEMMG